MASGYKQKYFPKEDTPYYPLNIKSVMTRDLLLLLFLVALDTHHLPLGPTNCLRLSAWLLLIGRMTMESALIRGLYTCYIYTQQRLTSPSNIKKSLYDGETITYMSLLHSSVNDELNAVCGPKNVLGGSTGK